MALDSTAVKLGSDEDRLGALGAVLAAALPDADPDNIVAAARCMDEVLSGGAPSPGWDRVIFRGWQSTPDGVRLAKRAIRVALGQHDLPAQGEVFETAYHFAEQAY